MARRAAHTVVSATATPPSPHPPRPPPPPLPPPHPTRDTEPPPPTGVLAGLLVHTTHAGASRLWGLFGTTPHWLAVRLLQVAGVWRWVVLDSTVPLRVLGAGVGAGSVHEFVAGVLAGGGHVLVVHRLDVVPP